MHLAVEIIAWSIHKRVNRARELVDEVADDVADSAVAHRDAIGGVSVKENGERERLQRIQCWPSNAPVIPESASPIPGVLMPGLPVEFM